MAENETGGGGAPAGGGDGGGSAKVVPLENFNVVVAAKNGLETQVKTLQVQLQTLTEKAATVDILSGQVSEWRGKAEKAEGRFSTFTELSGALGSTNTKVIDQFDSEWSALPEKERPARKAWVDALKAKPEEAPEHLRPWLAQVAADTRTQKPNQPKVPGTPPTPPNAPSSVSADEVRRIREEAVKSGDWSKWKDMRKSMGLVK